MRGHEIGDTDRKREEMQNAKGIKTRLVYWVDQAFQELRNCKLESWIDPAHRNSQRPNQI